MPSRPLSAETEAVVKLQTRLGSTTRRWTSPRAGPTCRPRPWQGPAQEW